MSEFGPEVNGNDDKIRDANIPPEKKENLTTSKPEEKKSRDEITDSNLHRPYFPAITYDYEIDDPIWRLGREDGKRGTPPKTGEELFKEASDLLFKHAKANRTFLQLRCHREKNFHQYSRKLGWVFLLIGFFFVLGEIVLSKNLLEKALEIGQDESSLKLFDYDIRPILNRSLTLFLVLSIALISAFFKWIWDWDEINHEQLQSPEAQIFNSSWWYRITPFFRTPLLRTYYLILTLLCIWLAYDAFAELRGLTSQIEERETEVENVRKEIESLQKQIDISNSPNDQKTIEQLQTKLDTLQEELKTRRTEKNDKKLVEKTFWSFTICFALIGGIFLSEGLLRIKNRSHYREEEQKWKYNHKTYRDLAETINIFPQCDSKEHDSNNPPPAFQ